MKEKESVTQSHEVELDADTTTVAIREATTPAPAFVADGNTELATPQIFGGGAQFWSSLPPMEDTRKRAAILSKMMGPADFPIKAFRDKKFKAVHLLAHNVTCLKKTLINGQEIEEYIPATRMVVLLADGKTADSTASGVISSMATIFGLAGQPPWTPPLELTMQETDTRNGRRVHTLGIPVDDADLIEILKYEE